MITKKQCCINNCRCPEPSPNQFNPMAQGGGCGLQLIHSGVDRSKRNRVRRHHRTCNLQTTDNIIVGRLLLGCLGRWCGYCCAWIMNDGRGNDAPPLANSTPDVAPFALVWGWRIRPLANPNPQTTCGLCVTWKDDDSDCPGIWKLDISRLQYFQVC